MATIELDEIRHIARLARLKITDEEAQSYAQDLTKILALMDTLGSIDTDTVEPLVSPHESTQPLREDVVTESNQRSTLMNNAPQQQDGLFLVPQVIE